MKKRQMKIIALRAAQMASGESECTFDECYQEYMEQLTSGDYQCLRTWLGWKVEEGNRKAVEIMKLLIKAGIAAA